MNLTRSKREYLNTLSKDIFGSSSRWKRLIEEGVVEPVTEKTMDYVPGENGAEGAEKEVEISVLHKGIQLNKVEHHTVESVELLMLELKKKREEYLAQVKKQQEEQEAKKKQEQLEAHVQDVAGGRIS